MPHLRWVYEDDSVDSNRHAATASWLAKFLEISAINPVGNPLKLVHHQLADIMDNYDELRAGLEASDYAYLLTDSRHLLTIL